MTETKRDGLKPSERIALNGILLAAAVMLTSLESVMFAFLPAGIRIGLANIVIMLAISVTDLKSAFTVTVLKSVFVLLTRGVTAGVLSVSGGIPAFAASAFMLRRTGASYIMISVTSSLLHIFGQLSALAVMTGTAAVFGYAPIMGLTSAASGVLTGIILKMTLPAAGAAVKKYGHKEQ